MITFLSEAEDSTWLSTMIEKAPPQHNSAPLPPPEDVRDCVWTEKQDFGLKHLARVEHFRCCISC